MSSEHREGPFSVCVEENGHLSMTIPAEAGRLFPRLHRESTGGNPVKFYLGVVLRPIGCKQPLVFVG